MSKPVVAILNEHDKWQVPLIEKLRKADIDVREIRLDDCRFALGSNWIRSREERRVNTADIQLVINRISPSAKRRKNEKALFLALQVIEYFESIGTPVINGSKAFTLEISKIRQFFLLQHLKLNPPQSIAVNSVSQGHGAVVELSADFGFPILVKPNIGGSGHGAKEIFKSADVEESVNEALNQSPDGIAILQEYVRPFIDPELTFPAPEPERGRFPSYRVEMLGENHLYSMAIDGGLNRCPAGDCEQADLKGLDPDGCHQEAQFIEFRPDVKTIEEVKSIVKAGGFDICGVEYLIDDVDRRRRYFDINALSILRPKETDGCPKGRDPIDDFVKDIVGRVLGGAAAASLPIGS
jgi:hypothetical protein